MPWNPAIWWAMRRLRLAVEIDCDRRLLARGVDPRQYASLLLAVGERISATPFAWATALAGSRSSLETRVLAMSSSLRPRHYRLAIGGTGIIAAGLIAIACASPVPDSVVPPAGAAGNVMQATIGPHDSIVREHVMYRGVALTTACYTDPGCVASASADSARRVAEHPEYLVKDDTLSAATLWALQRALAKRVHGTVTIMVNGRPITMKGVVDSVHRRP
jgi:hypothetical protein